MAVSMLLKLLFYDLYYGDIISQLLPHIKAVFISKATLDSIVTAVSYNFNHFIIL